MKKLLRSKSGFTLVEMLISLAIVAILMTAVMLFFQPLVSMISAVDKNERAENMIVTIEDYINRSIRYSTQVTVIQDIPFTKVNGDVGVNTALKQMGVLYNSSPTSYNIGCISFRKYQFDPNDSTTIGTILCDEKVNVASDGTVTLDTANSTPVDKYKVFSDVYYNNFYLDFVLSDSAGGIAPQFDVLKMRSYVYDNSASALAPPEAEVSTVALSSSSTFMTLINVRINKDTNADYVSKFYSYSSSGDADSELDTYIFYLKRKIVLPASTL